MARKPRPFPLWLRTAFLSFLDYTEEEAELLALSSRGLQMITASPNAARVLAKDYLNPKKRPNAEQRRRIKQADDAAAAAKKHLTGGLRLHHAHSTVGLWSALEASVEDLVAEWLLHHPSLLRSDPTISQLKVSVGDFVGVTRRERAEILVNELDRKVAGGLRQGIDQFEALLETIGLSGAVEKETSRDLYEMQQLRHALVHRAGIADRRLLTACPWLTTPLGQHISITPADIARYLNALQHYWVTVINRARVLYGYGPYDPATDERLIFTKK